MTTAIGFCAEKRALAWAVISDATDPYVLIASGKWVSPTTYSEGQWLADLRHEVKSLMQEHKPSAAGIKYPDNAPPGKRDATSRERLRIEGVTLEAVESEGVSALTGVLATLGSQMGSTSPKEYLKRDDVRGMKFARKDQTHKQAAVAATAAMEKFHG